MSREKRRQRRIHREGKRSYKLIGSSLAGLGIVGALYFCFNREPTFEEAKAERNKRAPYVESVEKRFNLDELPYIDDVLYKPEETNRPKMFIIHDNEIHGAMKTVANTETRKSVVEIYDVAFNASTTEGDFISVLVDHEIRGHALASFDNFDGIGGLKKAEWDNLPEDLSACVDELNAYRIQVREMRSRNTSEETTSSIRMRYVEYYSYLLTFPDTDPLVDSTVLRKLREAFFIPELLSFKVSTKSGYMGPIITPQGSIITEQGIIELPDYLKRKMGVNEK